MQTVKASSTFGNSKWSAHCDVSDEIAKILQDAGFLWFMQRSPSSNAEKVLAGYEKRPEGFKRNSIEYSPEMAEQLKKLLGQPVEIEDDVSITPVIDSVVFHEIGASAEPKYKDEKSAIARHVKDGNFLDWVRDTVGFKGEVDREPENNVNVLKAVKAFKQRLLAENL